MIIVIIKKTIRVQRGYNYIYIFTLDHGVVNQLVTGISRGTTRHKT